MPRKLRCQLLCEDPAQESLFRPILERLFDRRRVYVEPRRPKNGGFTFVLAELPRLAKYVRQRPSEAVALLVVIDGDAKGFQERLKEIRERLGGEADDRIAICIPTRNIETWKLWLSGIRNLDEIQGYKDRWRNQVEPIRPRQLVDAWFAELSETQRQEEASRLPALAQGRTEIARLKVKAAT